MNNLQFGDSTFKVLFFCSPNGSIYFTVKLISTAPCPCFVIVVLPWLVVRLAMLVRFFARFSSLLQKHSFLHDTPNIIWNQLGAEMKEYRYGKKHWQVGKYLGLYAMPCPGGTASIRTVHSDGARNGLTNPGLLLSQLSCCFEMHGRHFACKFSLYGHNLC